MKSSIVAVARRAWHSPTLTTWASVLARALSFVVVLPLLLRTLEPEEVAIWYLLATIAGLQFLADLGFAPTFTRLIAYGMGGSTSVPASLGAGMVPSGATEPNWLLVESIWGTMESVYRRLTIVVTIGLGVLGSLSLQRPISTMSEPAVGWSAWGVVLGVTSLVFWGSRYSAYLQGVNEVALVRRWEAITAVATGVTSLAVIASGGGLFALVVASQAWNVVKLVRDWQLCRLVYEGRFTKFRANRVDEHVLRAAWPAAWRSALGISFSQGVVQASGLIYAQFAGSSELASYLLSLKLMQVLKEMAQAPFYSKLPLLARLRAEGRIEQQLDLAKRGMRLSHWTFVLGFVAVSLIGQPALSFVKSNVALAAPSLWVLLGLGFFAERFGAMHIQLYSTSNHIIWHIANGVTGTMYVAISVALISVLGVYAFAVALLVSYVAFYSWYAPYHDYRLFRIGPIAFERSVAVPPALAIVAFGLWEAFRK